MLYRLLGVGIALLLWCLAPGANAEPLSLHDGEDSIPIHQGVAYLEDPEGKITFTDILNSPQPWQLNQSDEINQGYNRSVWWFHYQLVNFSQDPTWLLKVAYPVLDYLDIYWVEDGAVLQHFALGDKFPFDERPVNYRDFVAPLQLKTDRTYDIYLRVRSSSAIQVPMTLWRQGPFHKTAEMEAVVYGLYFGALGIIIIYSTFVFVSVRDRTYLYYIGHVAGIGLFAAGLNGWAFQYLWPNGIYWNDRAILISLSLLYAAGLLFTNVFLEIEKLSRVISRTLVYATFLPLVISLASFFVSYATLIRLLAPFAAIACLQGLFAGIYAWRRGVKIARYYLLAWSGSLVGGTIMSLSKLKLMEPSFFTNYLGQLGPLLEVMLLSLALAERINNERKQLFLAQRESLTHQLLANENLQKRIEDRTREKEKMGELLRASEDLALSRDKLAAVRVLLRSLFATYPEFLDCQICAYFPAKTKGVTLQYTLQQLSESQGQSEAKSVDFNVNQITSVTSADEKLLLPIPAENRNLGVVSLQHPGFSEMAVDIDVDYINNLCKVLALTLLRIEAQETEHLSRIGAMAASIVHDLKNPIGAIQGCAQLAADDQLPPGQRRELLQLINAETHRLLDMAQEVLEVSKNNIQLNFNTLNVRIYFDDVAHLIGHLLEPENITFEYVCNVDASFYVDGEKIRRVLLNLATNARDALLSQQRQVPLVRLSVEAAAQELEIRFSDNGPGIPEAIQQTLYEPFVTQGKSTGTGLGMMIVKKFIDAHNGTIDFKSDPDNGTCFTIRLPLVTLLDRVHPPSASSKSKEPSLGLEGIIPPRVLLADDDPVNRMVASRLLQKSGLMVDAVENGQQAVDKFADNRYGLVLLDFNMPVMDGMTAATRLRERSGGASVCVLGLTAHSDDDVQREARASGMNGVLEKPLNLNQLAALVTRYHQAG